MKKLFKRILILVIFILLVSVKNYNAFENFHNKILKSDISNYSEEKINMFKKIKAKSGEIQEVNVNIDSSGIMEEKVSKEEMSSEEKNTNNEINEESFEDSINDEKSKLGINDFLDDSQKYINDTDFDISNIFNNSLEGKFDNNKILKFLINLLGENFKKSITSMAGIVIVVIVCSILSSITDNLGNVSTSKISFYTEYILVVIILMKNFSQIVSQMRETIQNVTAFSNSLIPVFTTLIVATGKISSANVIEPILLLIISFINNTISNLIIPIILASTSLGIISKISDDVKVDKISKFMKKGSVWGVSTALSLFITLASLEGGLTSNLDNFAKKTGKSIISVAVPVVGNVIGGAIDTISRIYKFIKKCCWNYWNCNNSFNLCETFN